MSYLNVHEEKTPKHVITRTGATQYLVLNSKNRTQSGVPGQVISQPWNDFRLQRPQNLMESFARRVLVSEVRFPWWIPNISSANNKMWITGASTEAGNPVTLFEVVVPVGFYAPADLVIALNLAITNAEITGGYKLLFPPVVSYSGGQYTFTEGGGLVLLWWFDPGAFPNFPADNAYFNQASLSFTLGMTREQMTGGSLSPTPPLIPAITGNITESLYTSFVDIVSSKFNLYTTNYDGSSDGSTSKQLICRLYLADETSTYAGYKGLYGPFLIHRQFKNPKAVMWNKDAVVDWLDVQVIDQFGQLIPLPAITPVAFVNPPAPTTITSSVGSYPDFQITMLATES